MDAALAALIGSLGGALVGASATFSVAYFQAGTQRRHERIRTAADLAIRDFTETMEVARRATGVVRVPPLTVFLAQHEMMLEIMSRRSIEPDDIRAVTEKVQRITEACELGDRIPMR